MWLKLSSGRDELVLNPDHVKRLLSEGAVETDDPRVKPETQEPEQVPESEQGDGSQNVDAATDRADTNNDRGPTGDEPAVHRPERARSTRRKS